MRQAGERVIDASVLERVLACPATQAKIEAVRMMLEGRRIRKVTFTNEVQAVGVVLHLNNGEKALLTTVELSLNMLLRDPNVAREEQDLYYRKHVYRLVGRRRRKKGTNTNDAET